MRGLELATRHLRVRRFHMEPYDIPIFIHILTIHILYKLVSNNKISQCSVRGFHSFNCISQGAD